MSLRTFLFALAALAANVRGDDGPDQAFLRARIHFEGKPALEAWVRYEGGLFRVANPENGISKRPIPGRSVLFMNKFGRTDSLVYCERKHMFPDSLRFFIRKTMSYDSVRFIEDISSDSFPPIPDWGISWLEPAQAELALKRKPVFTDLIVLEDETVYQSEHVYNYDSAYTKDKVRRLYRKKGRENPELKKAIRENRMIFVEESSP